MESLSLNKKYTRYETQLQYKELDSNVRFIAIDAIGIHRTSSSIY